MSAEPHVYEKQHFAASRREKSRTVEHATVEPCSTVALFTLVNSFFFFFYEKHDEKFSFFFSRKTSTVN